MSTKKSSLVRILLSMLLNRPTTRALAPSSQPPALPSRPLPADREGWKAHWEEQSQPWRTEPEIDDEQKKYLDQRRKITPDIEKGIYPFKDIKLSRADVEWLLTTHENGRGPVDWTDQSQRNREGLDLRGAILNEENLSELPLARLLGEIDTRRQVTPASKFIFTTAEQRDMAAVHMKGANLEGTHLEKAKLSRCRLNKANIRRAYLESANLFFAHLEEAFLSHAHLEGAVLRGCHLEGTILYKAHLAGADLLRAIFNHDTNLEGIILWDEKHGYASLADIRWGDANLTVVNWSQVKLLGDEYTLRKYSTLDGKAKDREAQIKEYQTAIRANRQLAVKLQDQGMNEDAARFAYRAQVLQRKLFWRQRNFWKWFGSALLALLAGYGYRMWRIIAAYLIIISICAAAYFILGIYYSPHITLAQAFLESIIAFHGRVFYELFNPNQPQIWVTAFEAVAGLVIEGIFIAMLAQRFFGK